MYTFSLKKTVRRHPKTFYQGFQNEFQMSIKYFWISISFVDLFTLKILLQIISNRPELLRFIRHVQIQNCEHAGRRNFFHRSINCPGFYQATSSDNLLEANHLEIPISTRSHPGTDFAMKASKFAKESRRADISRIRQMTSTVDLPRVTVGKDQTSAINRFALQIPMANYRLLTIQ